MYMHAYMYMYVYINTHIYIYTHVYMCVYVCATIFIYVNTHARSSYMYCAGWTGKYKALRMTFPVASDEREDSGTSTCSSYA